MNQFQQFINKENEIALTPIQKMPIALAFLPLLYIAWTDAELSKSELDTIRHKIKIASWLTDAEKQTLTQWFTGVTRPDASTLEHWSDLIREIANTIPRSSKNSLTQLGLQIARISRPKDYERTYAKEAQQLLHEIEDTLGIVSEQAYCYIFCEDALPLEAAQVGLNTAFDVKAMNNFLDGDFADARKAVRKMLSKPEFQYNHELSKEAYREKVLEWCKIAAAHGFGSYSYPTYAGGEDNIGKYLAGFETLAYFDLSLVIKFGVQFGLFGGSIAMLGTEYHHKKYLKDVGSLELPGCFAMTELGHGSNVREIETIATYDANTQMFIIHTPFPSARKDYIGNAAAHGQMATVFAQLQIGTEDYGVHAFLVPIRNKKGETLPGVHIEDSGHKVGLNGVDNGRLWFNRVRVPRTELLNHFADVEEDGTYNSPIENPDRRFFSMLGTLIGGRVGVPSAGLSATKSALTIAIRYAAKRRQFGPNGRPETCLLDYRTHQRRLMPLLANAYALDFALKDLLAIYAKDARKEDKRELEAHAAGLKAFATWNATATIQECREACGGQGYLSINRFADLKADTDVFTTFEGDNTVLMQLVAKGLLGQYKNEFKRPNTATILRYLGEEISRSLDGLDPTIGRSTSQDHLRNSDFQLKAFYFRKRSLQVSAARRLKSRIDRGIDPYDAFIRCQDHLMTLAHAHVEYIILKTFVDGVESCTDESLKRPLKTLCDLFALSYIEKNKGWYLESGYLEPVKTKAIRTQVNKLCYETRQIAVDLVNSFDIPDNCLAAPIAF